MTDDRKLFPLRVTEEEHARIRAAAESARQSMNDYILTAIDMRMKEETMTVSISRVTQRQLKWMRLLAASTYLPGASEPGDAPLLAFLNGETTAYPRDYTWLRERLKHALIVTDQASEIIVRLLTPTEAWAINNASPLDGARWLSGRISRDEYKQRMAVAKSRHAQHEREWMKNIHAKISSCR